MVGESQVPNKSNKSSKHIDFFDVLVIGEWGSVTRQNVRYRVKALRVMARSGIQLALHERLWDASAVDTN